MSLESKLKTTLDNLGYTNRTKPNNSQDVLDVVAHEFLIANFGKSYFEKRYKSAKERLIVATGPQGKDKIEQEVSKVKSGIASSGNVIIGMSQFHTVNAQIKRGATYIDTDMLKQELLVLFPNSREEIEMVFQNNTKSRSPTTTITVLK